MGSERIRPLGLLVLAAAAWFAAGALARTAVSAREGSVVALLAVAGLVLAWHSRRAGRPAPSTVPAGPASPWQADELREVARLQTRMEHVPVAMWLRSGAALQALSSRARRLVAPGGVRDVAGLRAHLLAATEGGALTLDTERGLERWQLRLQPLAIDGRSECLMALMPMESELEQASLQAWEQLVRILTHEIMNSLTPIRSLSEAARDMMDSDDAREDLRTALDAIARRAESLGRFVQTYREVSRLPEPTLAPVDLRALFQRLALATLPRWARRGGEALFDPGPPGLRLQADEGQLEQALLALLRNAEQATEGRERPQVRVEARQARGGRLCIEVRDNGPGVPAGLETQIFLPFFSAREGGQGIGLAVVRQLVHGMGGRVRHARPLEGGAAFLITF
jgi:C4-dicarboxylate-specific signal transduction histidine kinase